MTDLIERKAVIDTVVAWTVEDRPDIEMPTDLVGRIKALSSAQPELIAQGAYVRGFEQGRTQGMLDAKLQPTCNNLATDCISRQAALRLITGYNGVMDKSVAKRLLTQISSAQPEPQWIPCSERLPEYDGEMYLVTDYCEQINRRRIHVSYCYVNREGFWSDVPLGYKVLAWMPLPEPWRGEEQ